MLQLVTIVRRDTDNVLAQLRAKFKEFKFELVNGREIHSTASTVVDIDKIKNHIPLIKPSAPTASAPTTGTPARPEPLVPPKGGEPLVTAASY